MSKVKDWHLIHQLAPLTTIWKFQATDTCTCVMDRIGSLVSWIWDLVERKTTKRSGSPSSIERIGTWTTQNLYILPSNHKAKHYTPNIIANDLSSSSSLANMAALENPPQVALHTTDSLLLNMNGSVMTTPSVEQQMKLIGQWVHTGILIMGLITNPLIIYVLCKQRIGSE